MRYPEPPSLAESWRGRSDDLDGLLAAYFRHEMPANWPGCPVPKRDEAPATLPMPSRRKKSRSQWKSRLALAASVAFFLVASWALMGSIGPKVTSDRGPGIQPGDIKANLPEDHPRLHGNGGIRISDESLQLPPARKDKGGVKYRIIVEQDDLPKSGNK